jgi:hypothetical protein
MGQEGSPTSRVFNILGLVAATALIGAVCALFTRHGCLHPGPPVSAPEPGTARAGFCSAVGGGSPWLLMVLAPCAIVGMAALAWRGSPRGLFLMAITVWVAQIAVAGIANSLTYSVTI